MSFNPGVLYSWSLAKYAAAFFKISSSNFKRTFSFLSCLSSSIRDHSFPVPAVEASFGLYFLPHPLRVPTLTPSSFAV